MRHSSRIPSHFCRYKCYGHNSSKIVNTLINYKKASAVNKVMKALVERYIAFANVDA